MIQRNSGAGVTANVGGGDLEIKRAGRQGSLLHLAKSRGGDVGQAGRIPQGIAETDDIVGSQQVGFTRLDAFTVDVGAVGAV
jgi:hypothetical protein